MHDYDTAGLRAHRRERDNHFSSHYASPIPEEHQEAFAGLDYFLPDPALAVEGAFTGDERSLEVTSSTGGTSAYRVAGRIDLTVRGEARSVIALWGEEDEIFVPFRDGTSGIDSYGGGRYVPAAVSNDKATLDFNRALNPWCAYDEEFSCPLPPVDNWFDVAITAGEKNYRPR